MESRWLRNVEVLSRYFLLLIVSKNVLLLVFTLKAKYDALMLIYLLTKPAKITGTGIYFYIHNREKIHLSR